MIASEEDGFAAEYAGAEFGDLRLSRRLTSIGLAAARTPDAGFPQMLDDDAALEGTYRFFGNERVTPAKILAPHVRATAARCSVHKRIIIAHDTTKFRFGGEAERDGVGQLPKGGQGFFGHFSLAVVPGERREVLGVLALSTICRGKTKLEPGAEADRWADQSLETARLLSSACERVHVMDREADSYELFCAFAAHNEPFAVRMCHERLVVGDPHGERTLEGVLRRAPQVLMREVHVCARGKRKGTVQARIHPSRQARLARLVVSATQVTIKRPRPAPKTLPNQITLNVVHVREEGRPVGADSIDWQLITTLPVDTAEHVAEVVDTYRSRWVIEEYFKALKTGCGYEKRQLESGHALLNALAVLVAVAWRLLLLRNLSRDPTDRPATDALSHVQLRVLRAVSKKPLSERPTVTDAMYAVAALGGHLRRNGEPGWLTLGRGLHDLLLLELGWRAREGM